MLLMQTMHACPGDLFTKLQEGMRVDAALMLLSGACFPERVSGSMQKAPVWADQGDVTPSDVAWDQLRITPNKTAGSVKVARSAATSETQPEATHFLHQSAEKPWSTEAQYGRHKDVQAAQSCMESSDAAMHESDGSNLPAKQPGDGMAASAVEVPDVADLMPWYKGRQQPADHRYSAGDTEEQPTRKSPQPGSSSRKPVAI